MKIGVITYFCGTNYGTALQAFALCSFLRESGHDAEVVRYYDNSLKFQNDGRRTFNVAKITSKIANRVYNLVEKKHKEDKQNIFRTFRDEYVPHSKVFYNSKTIVNSADQYDCFICGSDQIWTPWNGGIDPVYWLSFVNDDRCKIAYAPSISNANFSDDAKNAIQKYCSSFRSISVREIVGEEFLKQLGINNVEKVLDPTLLLDDSWWSSMVMGGCFQHELPEEYILAFFLGNNRKQREKVMAVSKKMNLPIVTLPFQDQITFFDFLFGDIKLRNLMPQHLLYCIKNAKAVFTDSFHITVFSLVFHREVYVFKKFSDRNKNNQNSRVHELLSLVGCTDRIIDHDMSVDSITRMRAIDYRNVEERIRVEREHSTDFLQKALVRK